MSLIFSLSGASVSKDNRKILDDVSWSINANERWVIIGPNGAGKTTLLELIADWEAPNQGNVTVLGDDTLTTSAEWIRPRVGIASSGMAKRIPNEETVENAVVSAAYAIAAKGDETFEDIDMRRAHRVIKEWGLRDMSTRTIGSLSEGEVKRVQLARAIMTDPELLLLDEPTAGLDLGAREELLLMLSSVARGKHAPSIVMVTHHVEEIPIGFTHALILDKGRVKAQGPMTDVLTSANLSDVYGIPITVTSEGQRYTARAHFNV